MANTFFKDVTRVSTPIAIYLLVKIFWYSAATVGACIWARKYYSKVYLYQTVNLIHGSIDSCFLVHSFLVTKVLKIFKHKCTSTISWYYYSGLLSGLPPIKDNLETCLFNLIKKAVTGQKHYFICITVQQEILQFRNDVYIK